MHVWSSELAALLLRGGRNFLRAHTKREPNRVRALMRPLLLAPSALASRESINHLSVGSNDAGEDHQREEHAEKAARRRVPIDKPEKVVSSPREPRFDEHERRGDE